MDKSVNFGSAGRIFAWSVTILIVSIIALTFRGLSPLELRALELLRPHFSRVDNPVRILPIISTDDSPTVYFRYVSEIVAKLKKAGARVVLVPIPPSAQNTPETQLLIRRLAGYGNVVFGEQLKAESPYLDLTDRQLDDPANWWSAHPTSYLVPLTWGISSVRSNPNGLLLRFVPNQYRESLKGCPVPDVALQAIKKFAGYPDSAAVFQGFGTVSMGRFRIPVWEDGFAYVKSSILPFSGASMYAFVAPVNDTIRYVGYGVNGREMEVTDSTWTSLAENIVIIDWSHLSSRIRWRWFGYAGAYVQVINAILSNTFVHRYDQWNLAIIFVLVILSSALVASIRTWLSVLVLIATGLVILGGCLWLFANHNILFDPVYVMFSLMLCMTILPVAKVSWEKENFRRQLELANEELAVRGRDDDRSGGKELGAAREARP